MNKHQYAARGLHRADGAVLSGWRDVGAAAVRRHLCADSAGEPVADAPEQPCGAAQERKHRGKAAESELVLWADWAADSPKRVLCGGSQPIASRSADILFHRGADGDCGDIPAACVRVGNAVPTREKL